MTYTIEALEKFVVRTTYVVEADSKEEAESKARNGEVGYDSHSIEEWDSEWLETVSICGDEDGDEGEPAEPKEEDWVTEDHITFREHGGQGVIRVPVGGPWQLAVRDRMDRDQYWPNVWFLSDHGNYHLMSLEDDDV